MAKVVTALMAALLISAIITSCAKYRVPEPPPGYTMTVEELNGIPTRVEGEDEGDEGEALTIPELNGIPTR